MNNILTGYATRLLKIILIGTIFFSFTPYLGKDIITLFDTKRFFVIAYMLLSATVLIIFPSLRHYIIQTATNLSKPTLWVLVATISLAFIANMTGLYWFKSQSVFIYLIMLMLMTFLLKSVVLDNQTFINRSYIWISIALFGSVSLGFLFDSYFGQFTEIFSIYSFVNPRFINHVQIWLILPLLYLSITNKGHKNAWLFYIPTSLQFSIIYALDGRGVMLATLSGVILLIIIVPSLRIELIKKVVISLIIGYLIKFIFLSPIPLYLIHDIWPQNLGGIRTGSSSRMDLWGVAVQMIDFWGNGGDTFVCHNDFNAAAEHNSILNFAIDWGVIPTIGYISLVLMALYRVCKTTSIQTKILGITMLSGFGYSLISNVVNTPLSQGLMMISVALFWASLNQNKTDQNLENPNSITALNHTLSHGLLIFVALWTLIFIGYKAYDRIDNNQYRDLKVEKYRPQFWAEHNCMNAEPKLEIEFPKYWDKIWSKN